MQPMWLRALIAALLSLVSVAAQAQAVACGPRGDRVIHINGINTTFDDAILNQREIARIHRESAALVANSEIKDEHLFYNPTGGPTADLVESISSLQEFGEVGFSEIALSLTLAAAYDLMVARFASYAQVTIPAFSAASVLQPFDDIVTGQAAYVASEVRRGRRVFIYPHSQGNLFAIGLYAKLMPIERQYVTVIHVANPSATILTGRSVTAVEDKVIGGIVIGGATLGGTPGAGNANTTQGNSIGDSAGHNFRDFYLRPGSRTLQEIREHIALASRAPSPQDDPALCLQPIGRATYSGPALQPAAFQNGQPLPVPGPVNASVTFTPPILGGFTGTVPASRMSLITLSSDGVGSVTMSGIEMDALQPPSYPAPTPSSTTPISVTFTNGTITGWWIFLHGLHLYGSCSGGTNYIAISTIGTLGDGALAECQRGTVRDIYVDGCTQCRFPPTPSSTWVLLPP